MQFLVSFGCLDIPCESLDGQEQRKMARSKARRRRSARILASTNENNEEKSLEIEEIKTENEEEEEEIANDKNIELQNITKPEIEEERSEPTSRIRRRRSARFLASTIKNNEEQIHETEEIKNENEGDVHETVENKNIEPQNSTQPEIEEERLGQEETWSKRRRSARILDSCNGNNDEQIHKKEELYSENKGNEQNTTKLLNIEPQNTQQQSAENEERQEAADISVVLDENIESQPSPMLLSEDQYNSLFGDSDDEQIQNKVYPSYRISATNRKHIC